MNVQFLVQLIGLPLTLVLSILSAALFIVALILVVRFKNPQVLAAFQPLTWLPVAAGIISTFIELLSSIGLQLSDNDAIAGSSSLLFQMTLVPLLASLVATMPGLLTTVIGRYLLAWKASGLRWTKPKASSSTTREVDPDEWVSREADDYLEKLVRPR
ncbi:hypothetical protein [Rhodopirellula bahusiensis]|uniref:hypothetical protein n=1 Tax=Rhodopirellula bahusiensis TaxID=2014065 RepID=UPI003263E715